jgi:hypothetical protein
VVLVSLEGASPVAVRRPSLLGAILIKSRVVANRRKEKFASDREDLIRLLSYVEDPRRLADEEHLKTSERRWLRDVEEPLAFADAGVAALFPTAVLERAEQALRLMYA